jgi:predicted ATPase
MKATKVPTKLRQIQIWNFKSYSNAILPLAPLTLMIGANASGKSNAIEALQMFSWLAKGRRLDDIFRAVQESEVIMRGRPSDLTNNDNTHFYLGCCLNSGAWDFLGIGVNVGEDALKIRGEQISKYANKEDWLYKVPEQKDSLSGSISVTYNNFFKGPNKPSIACSEQQAVFTQLISPARFGSKHKRSQTEIPSACHAFINALENIIFLDPEPKKMRQSSFPQDKIFRGDGSNLSSVLHGITANLAGKNEVLSFVRELPEQNITDIDYLEGSRGEVLVQLAENFGGGIRWRDASVLSDGTLRILSVAAAILSAPEGSIVVIEEVDNGVHPSRVGALLSSLDRISRARNLSILLTSHNPALLDALPLRALPDVVFCYRDPVVGDSRLVRLSDLKNYAELMAQGPLGRLVTQGIVDRIAKKPQAESSEVDLKMKYLEKFQQARL